MFTLASQFWLQWMVFGGVLSYDYVHFFFFSADTVQQQYKKIFFLSFKDLFIFFLAWCLEIFDSNMLNQYETEIY